MLKIRPLQLCFPVWRTALLCSFVCFALGCTHTKLTNYPTLSNKGILPLSTTNAFLGSNLFLGKEVEASSYLFRFFEARGAPTAIEIIEDGETPPRLLLFYPRDHEVFVADIRMLKFGRQWVVRGPYEIEREDFRKLKRLDASMNGEPIFQVYGNPFRFRFQSSTPQRVARNVEPEVPVIPMPTPRPRKKPKKEVEKPAMVLTNDSLRPKVPDLLLTDPKNFKPLNTDQQAIAISQGYARRASNGDVLHNVEFDYETLTAVTSWYTGSNNAESTIAQINNLQPGQLLPLGTQIRVPLNLLERFKRMPETHLGSAGTTILDLDPMLVAPQKAPPVKEESEEEAAAADS